MTLPSLRARSSTCIQLAGAPFCQSAVCAEMPEPTVDINAAMKMHFIERIIKFPPNSFWTRFLMILDILLTGVQNN
jgi:hypothetical protein